MIMSNYIQQEMKESHTKYASKKATGDKFSSQSMNFMSSLSLVSSNKTWLP